MLLYYELHTAAWQYAVVAIVSGHLQRRLLLGACPT